MIKMKGIKKVIGVCAMLAIAMQAMGAKSTPMPVTITQSDGTRLTVYGHGDEYLSWQTTSDGVLLVQKGYDFYIATVDDEGVMTATAQLAHEAGTRSEAEEALAYAQDKEAFYNSLASQRQRAILRSAGIGTNSPAYFPHMGSPKALVVLVQFQDVTFVSTDPVATFDNYLNGTKIEINDILQSQNFGSVKKYFHDASGGQFAPQFDIKGPVTVSQNSAYYGADNGSSKDVKLSEMLKEACELALSDITIPDYDANGDGTVDLVYFIYAGYSQSVAGNSANDIWPKSGVTDLTINGTSQKVRYGINNELNYYPGKEFTSNKDITKRINGIGLFCHEFSHTMGLPDLYPTVASAQIDDQAMEYWSLMDGGEYVNNGYTPTPYTPWEKEVMGWQTLTAITMPQSYTLNNGEAYKVEGDNDEYVILHNIQQTEWASKLLGHGMLVYRIDYPKTSVNISDAPNNTAGKPAVTIVPADGKLLTSYNVENQEQYNLYATSHAGDPYPGTSNVTEINTIKLNKSTLERIFTNITETDGVITFTLANTTGIEEAATAQPQQAERIYTVDGRYVGKDMESLTKGVYIRGNKKFVVK